MNGGRVLLVDDDELYLVTLQEALELHGYAVEATHDGDEAGTWIEDRDYRAALVDLNLTPQRNEEGLRLVRQLRGRNGGIRIVLLTAAGGRDVEARASSAGADAYLQKPVTGQRVVDLLQKLGVA